MPVAARTAPGTRRKEIRNTTMTALGRGLRRLLDGLYFTGGVFAALCLISILAIIVAQMIARWTGMTFPGATSYAGYAMASASFFAFAHCAQQGRAYPRQHPAVSSRRASPLAGSVVFRDRLRTGRLSRLLRDQGGLLVPQAQRHQPGPGRDAALDTADGHGSRRGAARHRHGGSSRPRPFPRRPRHQVRHRRTEPRGVSRHGNLRSDCPLSLRAVPAARQRCMGRPCPSRRRLCRHGAFHHAPGRRCDDHRHLGRLLLLDADRAAAVHLDGRDPLPHAPVGGHVPRSVALDGEAPRRPAAYQRGRLHGLCRRLRFLRRRR